MDKKIITTIDKIEFNKCCTKAFTLYKQTLKDCCITDSDIHSVRERFAKTFHCVENLEKQIKLLETNMFRLLGEEEKLARELITKSRTQIGKSIEIAEGVKKGLFSDKETWNNPDRGYDVWLDTLKKHREELFGNRQEVVEQEQRLQELARQVEEFMNNTRIVAQRKDNV